MGARPGFPFSAVVGHADLRRALLLTAVDPGIGGVLVRGEKGTAKSTIVRALAALIPDVEVVDADRFSVDVDAGEESPDGPFPADAPRSRRPARLVELPVGASEDRLIGSLDLQEVLGHGRASVQPGLLAAAHRGVLYVDEVNLLHDHLVDLLLDAAASGRAHVERDGVSLTHPAAFLLVGTMNPEEGELRPQLLDRFGLTVHVVASREVAERTEVVRRRLAYDADPAGFAARFADGEDDLRARLVTARARLGSVALPDAELVRISALCAAVDVDGMRADVVLARTAIAHAAWRGADAVDETDVREAARLALPHRRRRDPFDEPHLGEDELDEALRGADEAAREATPPEGADAGAEDDSSDSSDSSDAAGPDGSGGGGLDGRGPDGGGPGPGPDDDGPDGPGGGPGGGGPGGAPPPTEDGVATGSPGHGPNGAGSTDSEGATSDAPAPAATPVGAPAPTRLRARRFEVRGTGEGAPGRRSRARGRQGRTVRATADAQGGAAPLHLPATVLAAARRGVRPGVAAVPPTAGPGAAPVVWTAGPGAAPVAPTAGSTAPTAGARTAMTRDDLRHAVREGREGNLVLFCVDASGSMAARRRMTAVTGAVAALLRDAYQRRDRVGVVVFRGASAEVVLPPTTSVHAAHARLHDLRTGGRTPLAEGLRTARRVLRTERTRDPRRRGLLVVLTDGRATGTGGLDAALFAARGLARDTGAGVRGGASMSTVVVDCESGPVRLGLAGRVAGAAAGTVVTLSELTGEAVAGVVDHWRAAM